MRVIKNSEIEAVSGGRDFSSFVTQRAGTMCSALGVVGKDYGNAIGTSAGTYVGSKYGTEAGASVGAVVGSAVGNPVAGALVGGALGQKYGGEAGGNVGGYLGGKVGEGIGSTACNMYMDRMLGSGAQDGSMSGKMEIAEIVQNAA